MLLRRPTGRLAAAVLVAAVAFASVATFASSNEPAARAERPRPLRVEGAALRARFAPDSGRAVVGGVPTEVHGALEGFYAARQWAPAWRARAARRALLARLDAAPADGLRPAWVHADAAARLERALAEIEGLAPEAFEAARPRAERLATDLDLLLTDGFLRYADALLGRRVDARRVHGPDWLPTRRAGEPAAALARALDGGRPAAVVAALDAFQPPHPEYHALRAALARLRRAEARWAPLPDGLDLRPGVRSVRVPYVRERLHALGFAGGADSTGWARPDPYLYDADVAGAVARFRQSRGLAPDSVVDAAATQALDVPLARLAEAVERNLERWRWLPDSLGDRHVLVNLPAFALRARERTPDGWRDALAMEANIGNARTQGWTTPVISDSIVVMQYQPTWYVPASLAAAEVFPLARADSTALTRRGFEVYRGGARVDPLGVKWDSVSVAGFRFVQRPGPANPLGRVKFSMTNPYAILIHDTPRRQFGGPTSSGCVQAADAETLGAYLLGATNGWEDARAREAYRGGRQQTVRLDRAVPVHLVYFTAWPEPDGAVRLFDDVYGHDRELAAALGHPPPLVPERPAPDGPVQASRRG